MVILIDLIILALGIAMRVAAVLLYINLIESVTENACCGNLQTALYCKGENASISYLY